METLIEKQTYLERKRQAILELGYEYIRFRSRVKKSLAALKKHISSFHSIPRL